MTKAKESKNINLYHNLRGYKDTYKRFPIPHKTVESKPKETSTSEKKTTDETK